MRRKSTWERLVALQSAYYAQQYAATYGDAAGHTYDWQAEMAYREAITA